VPLLVVALLVLLALPVLIPLSLVQRYRTGTGRRMGRRWLATINVAGLALSAALLLTSAAVTSAWVSGAFTSALAGLLAGSLLGLLGLAVTRWEPTGQSLYYTPNRWLVLTITLVVASRMLYGFWRVWHAWQTRAGETSWIASSGVAGSVAVGGVAHGYYLTYWVGVRRRLPRRHARRL
jgi:hypothetical protein